MNVLFFARPLARGDDVTTTMRSGPLHGIWAFNIHLWPGLHCLLVALFASLGIGATRASSTPLPRSTPEEQGVASGMLLDFVNAADREVDAMNSFMLVRHGRVVAEGWWAPYGAESPHELYSLSKSFTSTAVGMAVAEHRFSVNDTVLGFFPGDGPTQPGANLQAMRVRDLLTMSTGHQDESPVAADRISTTAFLAHPVPHKPGTHFKYNTPATYMLSAIVQKVTGQTVLDYLTPRLFEPLGIEDPTWATSTQGISLGGYGLRVRTEDIAKLGQLYLQKGEWNEHQLLPAAWVAMATSRQVSNGSNPDSDWEQGYGFQFWRCRHDAFRGDGAFGQYCVVLPGEDAVLAITSGVRDMQHVLNVVWDRLLPALQSAPLASNPPGVAALRAKLAGLSLRPPEGSAAANGTSRFLGKTYRFPDNEHHVDSIRLTSDDPQGNSIRLVLGHAGREERIACGREEWQKGQFPVLFPDERVAARGAWTDSETFTAKVCAYETPFFASLRLHFGGDAAQLEVAFNAGFGPLQWAVLEGHSDGANDR